MLPDQVVPRARYPWTEERVERLLSGQELLIRPARITDEKALQDLLYRLSDDSTYRRFLCFKRRHPRTTSTSARSRINWSGTR